MKDNHDSSSGLLERLWDSFWGGRQRKLPQRAFELELSPGTKAECGSPLSLLLPGGVALEMLWCPAGSFIMGSPATEAGRTQREHEREITFERGFWLGKYPVTQEQYAAVTGISCSHFSGHNLPAECVLWEDALAFCRQISLSADIGLPQEYHFALPLETQWEYACRAGTSSAFNSGEEFLGAKIRDICPSADKVAWYRENSGGRTHAVGKKLPNVWGFYDMHGNVWEWCWECPDSFSQREITKESLAQGELSTGRGGCWSTGARFCRSAFRCFSNVPRNEHHNDALGFRLALTAEKNLAELLGLLEP